jgi:hypothetical protein
MHTVLVGKFIGKGPVERSSIAVACLWRTSREVRGER